MKKLQWSWKRKKKKGLMNYEEYKAENEMKSIPVPAW